MVWYGLLIQMGVGKSTGVAQSQQAAAAACCGPSWSVEEKQDRIIGKDAWCRYRIEAAAAGCFLC